MLSNNGTMGLERIHTMLTLISNGSDNEVRMDMNLIQLRHYLQTLVDNGELDNIDGVYSLVKKQC